MLYVIVHVCLFFYCENADLLVNYIFIYIYNSHISTCFCFCILLCLHGKHSILISRNLMVFMQNKIAFFSKKHRVMEP
jgi:hypothetical protein